MTRATRAFYQRLLRVQDVKRGALSGLGLPRTPLSAISDAETWACADATVALPATSWPPCRNDIGAGLIALLLESETLLR